MSDNTRSVAFAAVLSLVCCVLITAACTGLQKYQKANIELDRQINIVRAAGLVDETKQYSADEINRLYHDRIVDAWTDSSGELMLVEPPADRKDSLPLYVCREGEGLYATIIPLNVRGLWGSINGYLALGKDGATIVGFSVARHAETPGLGGEIESAWFRHQFKGKKIVDLKKEFVSVSIAKGVAKDKIAKDKLVNYVDGISGATLTGKYLSQGLKETLVQFEPLSGNLRKNGAGDIRFREQGTFE